MLIGYARVSTTEQDTTAQITALKAAGCERVFHEKASGGRWERPELIKLLDQVRKDDVLVVWKLDRLSRSLRDVLIIMETLDDKKAGFRSLTEQIDTTSAAGRMIMQLVGAFAEFERAMLRERTKVGLEVARKEGRIGGRRPKLSLQQKAEIIRIVSTEERTAADAARLFDVHPATVSRLVSQAQVIGASAVRAKALPKCSS
jgi:DNA invertase Pin-like site-specific DNA recombinase